MGLCGCCTVEMWRYPATWWRLLHFAKDGVNFYLLFGVLFQVFVNHMPLVTARFLFRYRERRDFLVWQHRVALHVILEARR